MSVAESAGFISPSVPAVFWDWRHLAEYTRPAVTQLTQGTLPHMPMMDVSKQELEPMQIHQWDQSWIPPVPALTLEEVGEKVGSRQVTPSE